jgi:hypothetical protein
LGADLPPWLSPCLLPAYPSPSPSPPPWRGVVLGEVKQLGTAEPLEGAGWTTVRYDHHSLNSWQTTVPLWLSRQPPPLDITGMFGEWGTGGRGRPSWRRDKTAPTPSYCGWRDSRDHFPGCHWRCCGPRLWH